MAELPVKISNLKTELRAATQQAQALGLELAKMRDSADSVDAGQINKLESQFQNAVQKASQLKDQINDTNEQINVLTAGSKFEAFSNSLGDIAGKIGSLDFGGAAESAQRLTSLAKTLTFSDAIQGVKDLGTTFVNLGKALLANPLFLIAAALVGIGLAVKGLMDKQRADVDAANEAIKKSNEERNNEERKYLALVADDAGKTYQLKKKFAEQNLADTKAQIKNLEDLESSFVGLSEEQEKDLADLRKTYNQQRVQNEIDTINELNRINGKIKEFRREEFKIGLSERDKEKVELIEWYQDREKEVGKNEEAIAALRSLYNAKVAQLSEKFRNEDLEKTKEAAEKQNQIAKEASEKRLAEIIAFNQYVREVENDLFKAREENEIKLTEIFKREEENRFETYNQRQLDRRTAIQQQNQLEFELTATKEEREIAAVDAKYIKLRELANGDAELLKQLAEKNGAEVDAIKEKYAQQELNRKATQYNQEVGLASAGFGAIADLAESFAGRSKNAAKKAFEITKAANLAQAIANTYLGATSAFAQTPGGIGIKVAAAAIATASGLANVARIAKTKFDSKTVDSGGTTGGAPSSSGGFGESQPATPAFNLFGQNNNANNLSTSNPTGLQTQSPMVVQVSVSETEITSTQNFVRNVRESAVL